MALIATFEKQPAERLDYDIDYSSWLASGDKIISATSVITPTGQMEAISTITQLGKRAKLWVSQGVAGVTYKVEVTVTTEQGRVKQDEVSFRCKEY